MKLCIIHDLAESIIGDYMPEEISILEKHIKEDNAMKVIISSLICFSKIEISSGI